ncbi:MAG: PAS domain-containing sensor histidine kinase, partial [Desulfotignum sp.]
RVICVSASAIVAADCSGKIELMNSVARELFGAYNGGEGTITHTEQHYPPGKAKEIMRMLRDEKMASLGQLAAGEAHQINNPLAGVLFYASLFLPRSCG